MNKTYIIGPITAVTLFFAQTASGAGTFQCQGAGVNLNGSYGSMVGRATLTNLQWDNVVSLDESQLAENSSAYRTSTKLLAIAVTEDKRIELESEGAAENGEDDPIVYGGIIKVSSWSENAKKSTKTVAVTCSASY